MEKQLVKKILLSGTLELLTGMRIGDSKENVEIGGIDNPIIRRRDNYQPYIPGSSLKGKIRCLLEQMDGENEDSKSQRVKDSLICDLFGSSENRTEKLDGNASRIIVRDASLTPQSAELLKESEFTDMPYSEVKWENVIDRVRGTAEHPRQMERVPAGAVFSINFVVNVFHTDSEEELLKLFFRGIELLQNDYLGGSGSRGYGQVDIKIDSTEKYDKQHYKSKAESLYNSVFSQI